MEHVSNKIDDKNLNSAQPSNSSKDEQLTKQHSSMQVSNQFEKQDVSLNKPKKYNSTENAERINYLCQVSHMVVSKNDITDKKTMSSHTGYLAQSIGRKTLTKLSINLKRWICKGCGISLIPGNTAKLRHRSKRQKHLVVTCLTCQTIKRFNSDPSYKCWSIQPEADV